MGIETFYNAQEGTVLGRTCGSWTKILGFYLIYYTFLGFLFYGSVQVGMLRIESETVSGKTRGLGQPVIVTRTDQPGIDAWPQNMLIEDEQGLAFPLDEFKKTYGEKQNKYPVYVQKLEQFLLNACPFKKQCALDQFYGTDWSNKAELAFLVEDLENESVDQNVKCGKDDFSRKCLLYRECGANDEEKKTNCGNMMKIDYAKLRAVICKNDKDNCMINKPLFFVSLNKVINFDIMTVDSLDISNGDQLNPKKGGPSPVWQHDLNLMQTLTTTFVNDSFAFINCYIMDQDQEKGLCYPWQQDSTRATTGDKVDCDNMKDLSLKVLNKKGVEQAQTPYKISAIYPYIKNSDYKYSGFKSGDDTVNKKSSRYVKPFAMFQLENSDASADATGVLKNKDDKSAVRCNILAKNLEYPFISDDALMGNALLSQPGHGWVQLGFKTSDKKEE